jgi:CubicO group peptidase (beta-lactamase class C family)
MPLSMPTLSRVDSRSVLRATAAVLLALLAVAPAVAQPRQPRAPASVNPVGPWLEYTDPAAAGFDAAKLDQARAQADAMRSGAVLAVHRGRVFAAFGAIDRNFMAHSVRKSLAGALYGMAVAEKRLSMDGTLAGLGMDDEPPLTASEKQARLRDLVSARSGVYHGAAYAPAEQDTTRPARGSHPPGTFWFYNNWDFNALETIYERAAGADVFTAFEDRIAKPTGMEDYSAANGFLAFEPGLSRLPAHTFRISARDLARFGQLYLQEGLWSGRQIIPAEWVRQSLTPHSDLGGGEGYGYLWWTQAPGSLPDKYPHLKPHAIAIARGTGGQALFIIPSLDLVVVHRGDTDNNRNVAGPQIWALVDLLASAIPASPPVPASLRPVQPVALASQAAEPSSRTFVALPETALQRLVGDYASPAGPIRVFMFRGRLFVSVPAQGEAELFALSETEFTTRVVTGVTVSFVGESGAITGVRIQLGRQLIEGRRDQSDIIGATSARASTRR